MIRIATLRRLLCLFFPRHFRPVPLAIAAAAVFLSFSTCHAAEDTLPSVAEWQSRLPIAIEALHVADSQASSVVGQFNGWLQYTERANARYRMWYGKYQKDAREGGAWTGYVVERDRQEAAKALADIRSGALQAVKTRADLRARPVVAIAYEDGGYWSVADDMRGYTKTLGNAWSANGTQRIDPDLRFLQRRAAGLYAASAAALPTVTPDSLDDARQTVRIGEQLKADGIAYLDGLSKQWDGLLAKTQALTEVCTAKTAQVATDLQADAWLEDFRAQYPALFAAASQPFVDRAIGNAMGGIGGTYYITGANYAMALRRLGVDVPGYVGKAGNTAADNAALQAKLAEYNSVREQMAGITNTESLYPLLEAARGGDAAHRTLPPPLSDADAPTRDRFHPQF